jgi:hypothetical protein
MIYEIFTHTDRLVYLQKAMGDQIVILSEPDASGQLKISIEVESAIDILDIFHAGVSYGLDKMKAVYTQ